jgi:hypothetical protein
MVQTIIVLLVVVGAGVYVGRRLWRTLRPAKQAGCGTDCGCGGEAAGNDWAKT